MSKKTEKTKLDLGVLIEEISMNVNDLHGMRNGLLAEVTAAENSLAAAQTAVDELDAEIAAQESTRVKLLEIFNEL